jgi:hypothetical protein
MDTTASLKNRRNPVWDKTQKNLLKIIGKLENGKA